MKQKHLALLGLVFFVTVIAIQFVLAVDFNQPISTQDKATFDQILTPVMKIYNMAKYFSTAITARLYSISLSKRDFSLFILFDKVL